MPTVRVNDIDMYYERSGSGETLILISGFTADCYTWGKFATFMRRNFDVIVFDNRGAGRTSAPDIPYTIEQMAADTIGLARELGVERAHLVGFSMGGYIAQQLAYEHPQFVATLTLLNSVYNSSYTSMGYRLMGSVQEYLMNRGDIPLEILVKNSISWLYSEQYLRTGRNLEKLMEQRLNQPASVTAVGHKRQREALRNFDSSEWIEAIHAPVLVVSGGEDNIMPAKYVKAFAERLREAVYYCYEDAGHLLYIEKPRELATLITNILDESANW